MKWIIALILASSLPVAFAQEYQDLGVKVDTVAENLEVPWSVAWLPDGTMLFTERPGSLRVMQDGVLEEPILTLDVGGVEGGLLGVAVDPAYSENGHVYLYYTHNEFLSSTNKVVRYVYSDGQISEDKVILEGIPGGPFHDGGRIKFGPDGLLYIATGDAGVPDLSQDASSLGGKILRINPDGTIPKDNPFEGSPVYSIGHRNPQGLDWDDKGNLVITEHGPSGWKGSAHDEINLIIPGANYGWPEVIGDGMKEGLTNPILHTGDETWAPSGAAFYNSETIAQWTGKYFVATLRGSHLHMIDFDLEQGVVLGHQKLFDGEFGRLRDVAVGPDGNIYLLTSNRDGRGSPQINDDRILKISPIIAVSSFEECIAAGNSTTESHPRQCKTQAGLIFEEPVGEICDRVSEESPIFVTTKLDSYSVGDTLLAEGCVDETVRLGKISVTIQDANGETVAGGTVSPSNDGTFAREFVLDGETFPDDGEYSVVADADGIHHYTKVVTVPEFGTLVPLLGAGLVTILLLYRLAGRHTLMHR